MVTIRYGLALLVTTYYIHLLLFDLNIIIIDLIIIRIKLLLLLFDLNTRVATRNEF